MHVTDRVSCSETLLERLLVLLFWGLNQPHNGLWDLCHCRVTAVELGGRQRRIATRTQRSIYTAANQSEHLLTRKGEKKREGKYKAASMTGRALLREEMNSDRGLV